MVSFQNSSSQIPTEIFRITNKTQLLSVHDGDYKEGSLSQAESKTISMQHYKNLMQLIPKVKRMEDTIRRMEEDIASKDSQIEQLRNVNQCKEKMCISTSHLSNVGTL